jgi:Tfp pilus assembly protein PilX
VIVLVLAGMTVSALMVSLGHRREVAVVVDGTRSFYAAECGLREAMSQLIASKLKKTALPEEIGSAEAPLALADDSYWCEITALGEDRYLLVATGQASRDRTRLEQVVFYQPSTVWDSAIFAGNSSADPNYVLKFSGAGAKADTVIGNVYSGQDVEIVGDATIDGEIAAAGAIAGDGGADKLKPGVKHPTPDIAAMKYETQHDVNVAAIFSASAFSQASPLGGTAMQVSQDSPAHIFRKNPSDRASNTSTTAKDDYFLEDPYQPVSDWNSPTGASHTLVLSGSAGKPGPSGTNKLYYIDGNLWVHNRNLMSMRFKYEGADSVRVTFVVKGNVYFSDDVMLMDPVKDGVAFVAIKDSAQTDSGNIYFGDPVFGTLNHMSAYMYAENDFVDNNLDASGSAIVKLSGNMTAGNHVDIQRDFVKADGSIVHSKLDVVFDDRVSAGELSLPGLPKTAAGNIDVQVLMWREVAHP